MGLIMEKPEGKKPLGRPSRGRQDNIKTERKEILRKSVGMEWTTFICLRTKTTDSTLCMW